MRLVSVLLLAGCGGTARPTCPSTAPPGNSYEEIVRTEHFTVSGTTPREIRRDTVKRIPPGKDPGGDHSRDLARTDSAFCTIWSFESDGTSCHLAGYRMELHLTFVMPEWKAPGAATEATRTWWREDYALVAAHEQGHAAISIAGAKAMYQAGIALTEAATCDELDRRLQSSYDDILARTRREHALYDEAQGTLDHLPAETSAESGLDPKKSLGFVGKPTSGT